MRVFTGERDQRTISDSVSRAHRALLPNVPWADVDAMKRHRQRLKAPTPRRETLFRALAEYGTDFIHKDAYWLAGRVESGVATTDPFTEHLTNQGVNSGVRGVLVVL